MNFKSIKLTNFRNISSLNINLNPNINIFVGKNAQGKTNIVEAIYYLTNLKSFRTNSKDELIKDGCEYFSLEAIDNKNNLIRIIYSKDKQKILLNNTNTKSSDYLGKYGSVVFTPIDTNLFRDAPKIRRDYIDDVISLFSPIYSNYINEANRLKFERNKILESDKINEVLLDTYTNLLSSYSHLIMIKRDLLITKLNTLINDIYQNISNSKDNLKLSYISDFYKDNEEIIYKKFIDNLENDKLKRQTTIGISHDDYICYLNDKDIAKYGSQGQNRLAVLALKLSLIKLFKSEENIDAIVVLDDVLSELDSTKKSYLLNYLNSNNQLFITGTNLIKNYSSSSIFEIENGSIKGGDYNG